MTPARRVQLLTERAGRRWSRRVQARLSARRSNPAAVPELRMLEDQADRLFRRLCELDGPDPMAAMLRKAGEIEPSNPDDPDDEAGS